MNLYDAPADLVRKSLVGLGFSPELLAEKAAISSREVMDFLNDHFSENVARKLAPPLGLSPDALCKLPEYCPEIPSVPGITQVSVPFDDEQVNIWLVESADTTLVIDCGCGPDDLTSSLKPFSDSSSHLLITHTHADHIGGLNAVASTMLSTLHAPRAFAGCTEITAGDTLTFGPFVIHAIDLAGHHPDALGYRICGNGIDAIAVGDAVFAGSMGGCRSPQAFALARKTIEAAFGELGPDVIILPGHGPASTLGQERRSNPFLAAWMG